MTQSLDHRTLYRLPWSLPDNAIAWLEPTRKCNLACFGCYRENDPKGHKSLAEVRADLAVFRRLRNVDAISIAGGDPLTHPQIVEIVRMTAEEGVKPILNTNGLALNEQLLRELKAAGLVGVTFHIDSKQGRPGWKRADEVRLCELRSTYAEMVARVGGLGCAFNQTVYEDTIEQVPDVLAWAARNIEIVHTIVFITFRAGIVGGDFDYYVNGRPADFAEVPYASDDTSLKPISSRDVVEVIRSRYPEFAPAAYLNGTEAPEDFKWLLSGRLGARGRIHGYVGPRTMELAQVANHLLRGRYLAYADPRTLSHGRSLLGLSPLDPQLRKTARRWLSACRRGCARPTDRLHFQAVMVIQPIDILADGRQSMCDGCPDVTVWNGRLVWSCRLEEPVRYGDFVQTVRRDQRPRASAEGERSALAANGAAGGAAR